MRATTSLAALISAALGACYSPNLAPGRFHCDPGPCPDGQSCVDHVCQAAGGTTSGDMPAPPPASGCSGAGQQIGHDVWACRGGIDMGDINAPCHNGYHACTGPDFLQHQGSVAQCEAAGGFYLLDIPVWYDGDNMGLVCMMMDHTAPALSGCGTEDRLTTAKWSCDVLVHAFVCGTDKSPWSCHTGLMDAHHDGDDPQGGGTVCCPG